MFIITLRILRNLDIEDYSRLVGENQVRIRLGEALQNYHKQLTVIRDARLQASC